MSEFHEHAPNVKNFQFLEKKDPIFRKIRENFGNVQIIQKIIQNYSVVSLDAACSEVPAMAELVRRDQRGQDLVRVFRSFEGRDGADDGCILYRDTIE